MTKEYFVYITTNKANAVLYTGNTNNLARCIWEHKNKLYPNSFTAKYNVNKLLYYEVCGDAQTMIDREKRDFAPE